MFYWLILRIYKEGEGGREKEPVRERGRERTQTIAKPFNKGLSSKQTSQQISWIFSKWMLTVVDEVTVGCSL